MPMEIHRKALKERARQVMRQNVPPAWLVALLFWALTTGVSTVADLAGFTTTILDNSQSIQFFPLFFSLLLTMYSLVMNFGYKIWCLRAWRREQADFGTLIDGFGMAGRILLMEIHLFLRQFAWCLLPAVPATVIMTGAESLEMLVAMMELFSLFLIPYIYVVSLRYALAPYLLMDQGERWSASAAVTESVRLMRGWKLELFKLDLSFLGWYLLEWGLAAVVQGIFLLPTLMSALQGGGLNAVLTVAAGTAAGAVVSTLICAPVKLWLMPYQGLSRAGFYQARRELLSSQPPVYTYQP